MPHNHRKAESEPSSFQKLTPQEASLAKRQETTTKTIIVGGGYQMAWATPSGCRDPTVPFAEKLAGAVPATHSAPTLDHRLNPLDRSAWKLSAFASCWFEVNCRYEQSGLGCVSHQDSPSVSLKNDSDDFAATAGQSAG
ncbi:hypothetical protein Q31b_54540 [Novipirellula aureliae]|uniref:Uncharacterized protein n=1 Tax=Novipirellula aureliae TaxID=2527966 RepID=A0A5C6DF84_9BACT|nr:hypothetical protein Q31b_54540 [Novipirellula aureliae]